MKSKPIYIVVAFVLIIVFGVLLNSILAQARYRNQTGATIAVNTTTDEIYDNEYCSLREAIQSANKDSAIGGCSAGDGNDIIVLPSGTYTLTIGGAGENASYIGDLDITADVTLTGAGYGSTSIISDGSDRVFHIDPNHTGIAVEISGVSIRNGWVLDADTNGGGGILNQGTLTLVNVSIVGNTSRTGGGIRNARTGSLTLTGGTLNGNSATEGGGGIYSDGVATLSNCNIVDNTATEGGGVYSDKIINMVDVMVSGNFATNAGGGVYNEEIVELNRVTIYNNSSDNDGGGLYNSYSVILRNVTISSNYARRGGGIYNRADANLINVTLSGNSSDLTNPEGDGISNAIGGDMQILNTIVTNTPNQNCFGEFTSLGHNLSSDATCNLSAPGDIENTDPVLGILQDNGGHTQTHALTTGSPAIDAGDNTGCGYDDQRGFSRSVDGDGDGTAQCDIGAYEIIPGGILSFSPLSYTVDESDGSVTITVTRTYSTAGAVSVRYSTGNGYGENGAVGGADFTVASGTLDWSDGDGSVKIFVVNVTDDFSQEPPETINLFLHSPQGGAGLVYGQMAIITLSDNDAGQPTATPVISGNIYLPVVEK